VQFPAPPLLLAETGDGGTWLQAAINGCMHMQSGSSYLPLNWQRVTCCAPRTIYGGLVFLVGFLYFYVFLFLFISIFLFFLFFSISISLF
jgi:hypothetical protein